MRVSRLTGAGLALLASAATLTTAAGPGAAGPPLLRAPGISRQAPTGEAPVQAVAAGITRFGYELSRVTAEPGRNWVASPVSVAYAFGMARAGAAGETAAQLDRTFGFPATGTDQALNAISQQLATVDGPPPATGAGEALSEPVVCLANGIFTQQGFPVGQPFLDTLAAHYGAGVRLVDFSSDSATRAINGWVRQQTANRITKLFDQLDPGTRLVLANAIYFKGDWTSPFGGASPTLHAPFTRADGGTVSAPMMGLTATLRYAQGPGWQAVELPYRGGDYAMRVVVPTGTASSDDTASPDRLLSPDVLATVASDLRPATVTLSLPKWDFAASIDLRRALGKLGLNQVAGFPGIHPDVFLDQAVHRADITVDEKGTEAAAVTGLTFPVSAAAPAKITVRADRPFAFAIVHGPTGIPVFMGQVADPTARN